LNSVLHSNDHFESHRLGNGLHIKGILFCVIQDPLLRLTSSSSHLFCVSPLLRLTNPMGLDNKTDPCSSFAMSCAPCYTFYQCTHQGIISLDCWGYSIIWLHNNLQSVLRLFRRDFCFWLSTCLFLKSGAYTHNALAPQFHGVRVPKHGWSSFSLS